MAFSSLPIDESKIDKNWTISKKIINELMASIEEREILGYMHGLLTFSGLDYPDVSDANMIDALKRKGSIRYLPYEDLFFGTNLNDGSHPEGTFQVNHDVETPSSFPFALQYNVIFWNKDSINMSLAWKEKNVVFCIKDASLYWYKNGAFVKDEGKNSIPIYYSDKIIQRLLHRMTLFQHYMPLYSIDYDNYDFNDGTTTPEAHYTPSASDARNGWGVSPTTLDLRCIDTPVYAFKVKAYTPNDYQTYSEYTDIQAIHFSAPPLFSDSVLSPLIVNEKSVLFKDEQKEDKIVLAQRLKNLFGNPDGGPDPNGVDGEDIQKIEEDYYFIGNGYSLPAFATYVYFKRGALLQDFNIIPTTASLINWMYYTLKNMKWAVVFSNIPTFNFSFSISNTYRTPVLTFFRSLSYGGSSSGQPCGTFVGYDYLKSTVKGVNTITDSSSDGFQFADSTITLTPQNGANCVSFIYLMNGAGGVEPAGAGCGVALPGASYFLECYVDISNVLIWK